MFGMFYILRNVMPKGISTRGHDSGLADSIVLLVKLAFLAAVPLAGFAFATTALRKICRAPAGSLQGDVFIAGASLLPLGIASLLTALLGIGNVEVSVIVWVFAWCLLVLVLYCGLTKVAKLSDTVAVWAVPTMILLAGWISKTLAVAILTA
jgi:hypothetical protein